MKHTLTLCLSIITIAAACQQAINITPPVKSVTLYQRGAWVTQEATINLPSGTSTVVFHGLPSRIDPQSIQIASNRNITILSVSNHTDYLNVRQKSSKMRVWQDSLTLLNNSRERITNGINVMNDSKAMLNANRTVGGANTGTTLTNLKLVYEYYTHQEARIYDSLTGLQKRESYYNAKIAKVQSEIDEWRNNTDTVTSQVEAVISSPMSQSVSFMVSYLTYDAGWYPTYDLRATGINKPAELGYKANVYQHTGEEWKNINLTLSTANPQVNQTAPVLSPWYLLFYQPSMSYEGALAAPMAAKSETADMNATRVTQSDISVPNSVSENQLAVVEFRISTPYNLPSDNKPHELEIKSYQLNPSYHYRCIPKLDPSAFLMADVTGWDNLDLQPGNVSIYYAGAYIGKTYINTQNASDTLSFSLGRDKKIVVKRERIKNFSATKWLGENKTQTFGYTITVHNGHADTLSLQVFDQVPLSTDKSMVITVQNQSGAVFDANTGKLTWNVSLKAGETKKLTFSYSVKYPKDKTIQGLR